MTKYYILIACLAALIVVLTFRESNFSYIRPPGDQTIVVKDKGPTILFVGDVMLGRNVENLMNQNGQNYPFEHIKSLLSEVDTVVANLEGPILDTHTTTPSGSLQFSFVSSTPALLASHNINVVTIANNHTGDFGTDGYIQTAQFLDKGGIQHVGHPYTYGDEYIAHVKMGDAKILYVAFNLTNPNLDITKALAYVKKIPREQGEFTVAMVHGGTEYQPHSDPRQEKFYRGLIDAGADVVIAHHPHVVEEIELYHQKPIFYSLGNFIFDQYFSDDVQQGLSVKLSLYPDRAEYSLIPLKSIHSQPEIMAQEERNIWLKTLAARSSSALKNGIENGSLSISR